MIKRIFAPVQAWILLQGKCVGCGRNLSIGKKFERSNNTQKIICKCKRVYIFEKITGKFRRAAIAEAK